MAYDIDIGPVTLTELVTAVAASVPEIRRDLVERRIVHWVTRRVLEPATELHTGKGRSRLFDPEVAYIAVVLMRLPTRSIPEISAIARVLKTKLAKGGDPDLATYWAAAKNRNETLRNGPVFAAFNVRLDDAGERPIAVEIQMDCGNALESPSFHIEGLSAIVINLSDAFHGVRFP
jgi:hypothetical protein